MALTLFRAFSAESLVLRLPGPMAQAITFRDLWHSLFSAG